MGFKHKRSHFQLIFKHLFGSLLPVDPQARSEVLRLGETKYILGGKDFLLYV